ncbi:predicted protein, partial [Scheffersomyces stipitis CBS 6054]
NEEDNSRKRTNEEIDQNQEEDENKKQKTRDPQTHEIDLELQFDRAIEQHHREMSNPPEHQNQQDNQQDRENIIVDENESLAMIANQLDEATQATKKKEAESQEGKKTVIHEGISIPANSELFNTSSALAAYNALSSQLPPLAILANAHLAALPLPIVAPDYLPPRIQLLVNTLPTLDNLATQLLRVVAIGPYQKIIDLASNPDTPAGATYRDLTSLFEFTKRLYSEEDPFLSVEHIAPGMWKEGEKTPSMFRSREQSIESTLRKVNLATFLAATLGTIEVGFFYLNESFLDVFCPYNNLDPENSLSNMGRNSMSLQSGVNTTIGDTISKLLKPQAVLYLDLKTQAYISAIEAGERSREEILEDILPHNLGDIILARRGVKNLSPTEMDFIERCKARKKTLLNHTGEKSLSEEYEWFNFLRDLFEYVSKNMGLLIWGKKGRTPRSKKDSKTPHSEDLLSSQTSEAILHSSTDAIGRPSSQAISDAENIENNKLKSQEISQITSALLPSEIQEQQIHLRINPQSAVRNTSRRPWTKEEEKALRHALELKGPQWSTILELFGNGGKISESLKGRTQVQLKDKARNWKMFFLKSGLPVPSYLQRVTGDLEREDRNKVTKRGSRSRKTAAAPIPDVSKHQRKPEQ